MIAATKTGAATAQFIFSASLDLGTLDLSSFLGIDSAGILMLDDATFSVNDTTIDITFTRNFVNNPGWYIGVPAEITFLNGNPLTGPTAGNIPYP